MEILRLAARRFLAALGTSGRGLSMSSVISNLGELFRDLDASTHRVQTMADRIPYRPRHDTWMWISGAALPRVSTTTVAELLGNARIRRFASRLHVDYRIALHGLTIALPTVVADLTSTHPSQPVAATTSDRLELGPSVPMPQLARALPRSVRSFSPARGNSRNAKELGLPI